MIRVLCVAIVALACVLVVVHEPAWGAGELYISCGGTLSNGGGVLQYQYQLTNKGAVPVTLTLFYLGTMDLFPMNYTNWTAPAGFTPVATVADWNTLFNLYQTSVMATTRVKTAHGVVPPPPGFATPGGIVWSGSVVLNPNQQITFGFDNPHLPWDMEWFAEHPDPVNSSQGFLYLPIAGPLGFCTHGYVHGPGEGTVAVEQTTFGRIKALYNTDK